MKRPFLAPACALIAIASGVAAVSLASCAPGSDNVHAQGSAGGSGGSGGAGNSSVSGSGSGGVLAGSGSGDGGIDPDAACGLITEEAKSTPVNLYIAFDKSSSMAGSKWDSAKAGLTTFVNDPDAAGIRVALNFFPGENENTCDEKLYKEPVVPFGELPQNAAAIKAGIDAEQPDGFSTPIYPALNGALVKGIEVAANNPGEASAVLLVTDGLPQGPAPMCSGVNPEDPQAIADLAANAAAFKPPVKTFVIGLPGVNQAFANKVAAAGGTDAAILVSSANVEAEFEAALAKVRGKALPCTYEIPEKVAGGEVNPGLVNVLLALGGAMEQILPQDPSCAGEGWRYDDPVNPKRIIFCDASCKAIKAELDAKVQILLGCKTEVAQ